MIANKYIIVSKIGEGKFGQVFKGNYNKTGEIVAIKIEEKSQDTLKMLKHETTILNYLYGNGCRHIPFVYWFGQYNQNPTLIMSYYDCSLHDYIKNTPNITIHIIEQFVASMINILENIHSQYVIHRDIKPQNFMIKDQELYLIDFGLATIYVDNNKNHILAKNDKRSILGTPKFVSYNVHAGLDPSRRDDLISVGYIYMYLMMGNLPWSNILETPNRIFIDIVQENDIFHWKNQERKQLKSWTNIEYLCKNTDNDNYLKLFNYMEYVYHLEFQKCPNYTQIIADLQNIK